MWRVASWAVWSIWVLIWVEIGLQAFYYCTADQFLFKRTAEPIFAPNKYSGFFNKPNLSYVHWTNEFRIKIYTNKEGFRVARPGIEYCRIRKPDTFRVLLLGPSFAFGWGVNYEDSVAARLETMLKSAPTCGRKVEVINAGVPALSPQRQLNWLVHVGRSFQPDLIIELIYGSLEIDQGDDGLFADKDGFLERRDLSTGAWLFEEAKKSAIVFYGWMLSTELFAARDDVIRGAGRNVRQLEDFKPDAAGIRGSLDFYRQLAAVAKASGARLAVVYFPFSFYVHRGDWARWRHLGAGRDVDGLIALDRSFCNYLNQIGVDCLNGTPDLIKAAAKNPERLYYWLDIHWTVRGNLVAARSIAKHLAQRLPGCGKGSAAGRDADAGRQSEPIQ